MSFISCASSDFTALAYPNAVSVQTIVAPAVVAPTVSSTVEQTIYGNVNPVALAGNQVVTVNGETGLWTNQHEVENWRGEVPLSTYAINQDPAPTVVRKRQDHCVDYNQNVSVRYLNPPKPAPHGDIVIKQQPNVPTGPAPSIVIRQEPPRPVTPPTLIVREAPPPAPASLPPKLLSIPGKRLQPAPRKVVVEKLPVLPPKPQNVIIERWLPYEKQQRRVIFERNTIPDPVIPAPKNVVVQWETPCVNVNKTFTDLGVANADPQTYVQQYGTTLTPSSQLPTFVREVQRPAGLALAAETNFYNVHDLVGDVQALGLIDLDSAGLSEYKGYVSSVSSVVVNTVAPSFVTTYEPVVYNNVEIQAASSVECVNTL